MFDYQAHVEYVHDGDTVRLLIDHGMHIRSSNNIRLKEVWAPELATGEFGKIATDHVVKWVKDHLHDTHLEFPVKVVTEKDKQTFNRYVGTITCATCGDDLNAHMRKLGYDTK